LDARLSAVLAEWRRGRKPAGRIAVKCDRRILIVKVPEIDWIEAADNYVSLHVGSETHLVRETMASIETRLPEEQFIRISRSAIVNVERIKELQPMFHGDYAVILRTGARLTLSRNCRAKVNELLGGERKD
jgi:two-component system LytT family response regulator